MRDLFIKRPWLMIPNLVINLYSWLQKKTHSTICIDHECLVISHVCDVNICSFLVYVHDIIDDLGVLFTAIFAIFLFPVFCSCFSFCSIIWLCRSLSCLFIIIFLFIDGLNIIIGRYYLLFHVKLVALGILSTPLGRTVGSWCFNKWVRIVTLGYGLGLDYLSGIVWGCLVGVVIGLVCLHVNLVSFTGCCCSTARAMLLWSMMMH